MSLSPEKYYGVILFKTVSASPFAYSATVCLGFIYAKPSAYRGNRKSQLAENQLLTKSPARFVMLIKLRKPAPGTISSTGYTQGFPQDVVVCAADKD